MQQEDATRLIEDWTRTHGRTRDRLLPLLHMLQEEIGFIDDAAIPAIATALNLSRADVHGVVTFYHDFRRTPAGRHVVKLCRAESCRARGAAAIEKAATDRLGVPMGKTRPDGQVTLEPVYCLGLCAVGPNALVDGRPVARIDVAALDRIAQEIAA
ncbi:ATP synthase subunit E [Sphingobium sp. 22B]|uniref:NAD(P)H-dependent oxidoreductase subunit E n=1 Tax=unclassified Sphingobium TaxID=2611147 RepID=UPI000785A252|nr:MULTISPECIES: NAD(P)H-dependent oxidoreductase subunit E [unclassified Sphingobium]KXU32225.1 ATP synthase subunit E [Sphingobium sp. AM]KYC32119.1 ATP synthase subunit E [Sphingobium sp. 22B]OAP33121.1 NADH-quinone oxidoreductase subunit E [Sphingobium sp. 20006FA]